MSCSICGVDCENCSFKGKCNGCTESNGHPFGKECFIARCCLNKGNTNCTKCQNLPCHIQEALLEEFNALNIKSMGVVTKLYALKGSFVNLQYRMPSGNGIQLLDDDKIYLGAQICQHESNRCYGLAADENYLLVCEYGEGGKDAEIIVYKKR